ncbi:twitching motility protein PilT [Planctomycetia bacterium]|nr:twitching motility protein PilT [Planctomycetia bacterium]
MRVALDTNVLAYAEGVGDAKRCGVAVGLVERLPESAVLLPAQVLGELMLVLTRKAGRTREVARDAVLGWADSFDVIDSTWASFQSAFDLSVTHEFRMWDALVMAVAAENRCRIVLSEDLQHGFTWRGVTIVNPFLPDESPLLAAILSQDA